MGKLSRISPEAIEENRRFINLKKRQPMVGIAGGKVEDFEIIQHEPATDPENVITLSRDEIVEYQAAKRAEVGKLSRLFHHFAEYWRGRNFDLIAPVSIRRYVQRKRFELMENQNE